MEENKKKVYQFIRTDKLGLWETYTVQSVNLDELIEIVFSDYKNTLKTDRYAAAYWNEAPTTKAHFKELCEADVRCPLVVARNCFQNIEYVFNVFEI